MRSDQVMGASVVARSTLTKSSLLVLSVLLALCCSSCMVGDFITAYFNTYYNAQKSFSEAEDDIWGAPETHLSGRNLLLTLNVSATSKTKLNAVIDKCSKLFQYHPDSKLLDDALLMVGKSFYYLADFAGAERKFRELVNTFPESNLVPQARMYLAYALYRQNMPDDADTLAVDVEKSAVAAGDEDVAAYASMLLGQIRVDRKDYTGARDFYVRTGDESTDADFRASALLLAADMDVNIGDSTDALVAYTKALAASENYVSEYKSRIGHARTLGKLGRVEDEMSELDQMRRNRNYREYFGEIDLEKGNAYRLENDVDDAYLQYKYVDTAYTRSEPGANADYQLGQLYEHEMHNLDSAQVYYSRGRQAGNLTQWKIGEVLVQRGGTMDRYRLYRAAIQQGDSVLNTWKKYYADSAAYATQSVMRADSGMTGKDSVAARKDTVARPVRPILSQDSANAHIAGAMNELATLFFADLEERDSALVWYDALLGRYPESRYTPRAWFTEARIYSTYDSSEFRPHVDSLYHLLIDRYPQSDFAPEARRAVGLPQVPLVVAPSRTMYRQGEELYLAGHRQEAIDTLRQIAVRYPQSPEAARAQYTVGYLYENAMNLPDSALVVYHRLTAAYPASPYAITIQARLDTTTVAQSAAPTLPLGTKQAVQTQPSQTGPPSVFTGRRARQQGTIDTTQVALPPPSVPDSH